MERPKLASKDFAKVLSNAITIFQSGNRGREMLDEIRKIFLYQFTIKKKSKSYKQLIKLLLNLLQDPKSSNKIKSICVHLLRKSTGMKTSLVDSSFSESNGDKLLALMDLLHVIKDGSVLQSKLSQFESWLQRDLIACELILTNLNQLIYSHSNIFRDNSSTIETIERQMTTWLKTASLVIEQSGTFWRKDTQISTVELDGSRYKDFFTILNGSQVYAADQVYNSLSFSLIRSWLSNIYFKTSEISEDSNLDQTPQQTPKENRKESETETNEKTIQINEEQKLSLFYFQKTPLSSLKSEFRDCLISYCTRVIEQSDITPVEKKDKAFQKVSALESLRILDELCSLDKSLVSRFTPLTKKLLDKSNSNQDVFLALGVLDFVCHHLMGNDVFDSDPYFESCFSIISEKYYDSLVAFETMNFVIENRDILIRTTVFSDHVMPILRVVAWNPQTLASEFVEILPSLIHPTNYLEIFHLILDLPLLTASLEWKLFYEGGNFSSIESDSKLQEFRVLFNYIMRREVGTFGNFWNSSTLPIFTNFFDFLMKFHRKTLSPRVIQACVIIPALLDIYFDVILCYGSYVQVKELVSNMFERFHQLIPFERYELPVQNIISVKILAFFEQYPALIVDLKDHLISSISGSSVDFLVNIFWLIGEYTSPKVDERCDNKMIFEFYDLMETFTFEKLLQLKTEQSENKTLENLKTEPKTPLELSKILSNEEAQNSRLFTTLVFSFSKLAARDHELIPRALLTLTKIVLSKDVFGDFVVSRAQECVLILKNPSLASAVFEWDTQNKWNPFLLVENSDGFNCLHQVSTN